MNKFTSLLILLLAVSFWSCAKRTEVPEINVSRLDAEQSIIIARTEIEDAEQLGADVTAARDLLSQAEKSFSDSDFKKAKEKADQAADLAREMRTKLFLSERFQEDAAAMIASAEELLAEAKLLAADTSEAEVHLEKAKSFYSESSFEDSLKEAEKSKELLLELLKTARKKTYKVGTWAESRDCLWNIAAKSDIYNDPWKWKRIYLANRKNIKDPDLIYSGQILVIPQK